MDNDWQLLQPYWLLLFPALWAWHKLHVKQGLHWAKLISPIQLRYPPLSLNVKTKFNKQTQTSTALHLTTLAFALCIIALTQPQILGTPLNKGTEKTPVDVVLVVGTSISMVLRDYSINDETVSRMQMTKHVLQKFITDFKGRRLALVVLGSPAAVWLPLSEDKQLIQDAVQRLRPTLGGRLSDLGGALSLVAKKFGDPKQETSVLLFSDGGLQLGALSPQQGAEAIKQAGLKLHSIAIGSDTQIKENELGGLIHTPVDLDLMRSIAETSAGSMFQISDSDTMHSALQQAVSSDTSKHTLTNLKPRQHPLYPWLLGFAAVLLLSQQLTRFSTYENEANK